MMSAYVNLADRPAKRADARQTLGFRYSTFAKQTGGLVIVADGFIQGLETEGDPAAPRWFTMCDAHDSCVGHYTFADAKSHATDPCGWCEECRRERDADQFGLYFDMADELDGGLTMDDLDLRYFAGAREAADRHHLSWPPILAEAEEYALDHPELRAA